MRIQVLIISLFACFPVYSYDKWAEKVCEAMVDEKQKDHCFKALEKHRLQKKNEERLHSESKQRQVNAAARKIAKDNPYGLDCGDDFYCYAKSVNLVPEVIRKCSRNIEAYAKYQFKWTADWEHEKFPNIAKPSDDPRKRFNIYTAGISGNSILFQNGFGAWKRQTYFCWVDIKNSKIVAVDVVN